MANKYIFSDDYGIILGNDEIIGSNTKGDTYIMGDTLYETIYMKNYDKNLHDLIQMALPEKWGTENNKYSILKNYLSYTLDRLAEEDKILTTAEYFVFNTGLFTKYYEEIYLLANVNKNNKFKQKWTFIKFGTSYELDYADLPQLPDRADYFEDPSLLVFDWHCPIRVQYSHILEDHVERLPESMQDFQTLNGIIDVAKKKVMANYKLAVPQYFKNQIQLLIPLYEANSTEPSVALVLTKKNGYYQAHTCLSLSDAYNNARLIAKPESNWLAIE